ncbi:MAG: cupin domain-containing protein [Gaiellaceae bacterium MAG52_C11]|nr:cupin domain-containing protein [Candidatus Gaiellasilicea maunaloa]
MQTIPTRTQTTRTPTPTARTPRSAHALERAIAPIEADRFLSENWERRPLVVPRAEDGRFDDLLSVRDVDRLIAETAIRLPGFRLVKAGEKVSGYASDISWRPAPFTGVANVRRVLAEFERGATIVLQGLHHSWLPLARYCRHLEAFLGQPAQANAYLTPHGSQGLPVHHDTHEVLSLQVAGEKRWLVYEPALELPLKTQRYRSELGAPGEPVLDITLCAGDTLYLPRGWLHQALTSETDSLHITVGVNVRTWLDEARLALESSADDVEFRRGMKGGPAPALPPLDPEEAERRSRKRLVRSRRPILDGQLGELRALDGLDADTRLERRDTVIADLDETTLEFEGRELRFPERLAAELEFLVAVESPFVAADLPGTLDAPGRLVLLRRLVREGFLRRQGSRRSGLPDELPF